MSAPKTDALMESLVSAHGAIPLERAHEIEQHARNLEVLLREIKEDLDLRAEDGVVDLSNGLWTRLCDIYNHR